MSVGYERVSGYRLFGIVVSAGVKLCCSKMGIGSGIGDGCKVSEFIGLKGREDIAVNQGRESLTENSLTNKAKHL